MAEPGGVRFEAAEVLRLFPAFVWKAQLASGVYEPINAALRAEVAGLLPSPGVPPSATLWQSGHALHEREALAGFIAIVEAAIHDVLAFLKVDDPPFEITGCWANVSPPGGWHRMHSHPNNFLSGVYYVQVPEGTATINFHDPRPTATCGTTTAPTPTSTRIRGNKAHGTALSHTAPHPLAAASAPHPSRIVPGWAPRSTATRPLGPLMHTAP